MTEFAMGPSVVPALHLVGMRQHLKRGPVLYDSQDDGNDGYVIGEENMTCLTNLADPGGCQWPPVSACQWMKLPPETTSGNLTQSSDYGLQELYCAVAQQPEVSSQNEQKSYWSDESKSGDADDQFLNCEGSKSFRDQELLQNADDHHLTCETALDDEDSSMVEKRRSSFLGRGKDDYDQQSPDCNHGNLKPHLEKLGWKSVARHAENRRKRWAQADPLLDFWKGVSASRYAAPFRRPVALLEDYDTIVRQPMDLSTIRRQLENDESYSLESLRRDLMLMVTNALVYNKKGTETHDMALKLKTHATRLFEGHQKEASYSNVKLSPVANQIKLVTKVTKPKHAAQQATELPTCSESLPLAPVKKHRTMRRPRACGNNDGNGLRSDVAHGAAMDSSSEEEAAAVLICFSSGQSGEDKQALSTSKPTKSEYPKKRLKRVIVEADDMSAWYTMLTRTGLTESSNSPESWIANSVTEREGQFSHRDQCIARSDVSIMSAGPSPASFKHGVDIRSVPGNTEKYVYMATTESSQTHKFDKPGLSVNSGLLGGTVNLACEESYTGGGRNERTCMGLKHKWQERWRIQSAASSENSGSLQQSNEPIASKPFGDKYSLEGGSGAETNYRPFPQTAGACSSIATSGVGGMFFGQKSSPVSG